ncbi:HEAT repeat domain-containing protein [Halobellus limi]|uniref:HEAT repeat domain-containing protein n=1 Tax=Halobellus limi TaxID=699433 RepID=A0A1H5TDB7_9EURY|nr:HEAT repeat domain-containing protein [Halobellus limi]QCC47338.1 HEAT repeat domain-containing protein [Halobellus limi]SEF60835.1 HEAT repeat-containing protein [Halobellus limi]
MRDEEEATDGPTDPRVHPEESPGFGEEPAGLEEIEVSRDVTLGEATPRELQATDLGPVADRSAVELIEDLTDGDVVERRRAALALGEERPAEGVVDALVEIGLADDDSDVRQFAVESLGNLGGEVPADPTGSGDVSDESLGAAALEALADEDPWVRAEAVVALDRIDRTAYESHLEAALGDDHHAVRRNAAVSLFKIRGEDTLEILLDLSTDDSERVREWAAHLLAGVEDDRAERRLTEIAADESEPEVVRSTAARSLEADPGKFRRQFTGGIENDSADRPGESRLNRRPDL